MRTDILDFLQKEIYERCRKPANRFGMGCYYHIEAVVKNSEILAEKYNADKEIVMIAAWLHDVASVTDYALYEEHHLHGAEIAYELLSKLSYDESKICKVQNCIRNHRGSVYIEKNNVLLMQMRFHILTACQVSYILHMWKGRWGLKKGYSL